MLVSEDALHYLCIIKEVAVEQQDLLPLCLRACQPEGVDIVRGFVVLVVDEAHINVLAISFIDKVLNLLVEVARHDDELADASLDEGIHGTLQECSLAYLQEAFGRVERERTKARGSARSKDDGFHFL